MKIVENNINLETMEQRMQKGFVRKA